MAIPLAAALLGGSLGGSLISGIFGKKAASKEAASAAAAVAEQRRQFDLGRADLAPYRETGVNALGRLNTLAEGDFSGFETSPGFQFRRDEGQRDIGNSFAARGGAFSGNALKALTEFNQNLASNEFGNYFERNARLAGIGGAATNTGVYAGAQSAGNIGNALMAGGRARASGVRDVGNALNAGIGNYLYGRGAGLFGNNNAPADDFLRRQGFPT